MGFIFNQAVLAHELGHLKCDHGVWLTFANIITLGAYSVPGMFCDVLNFLLIMDIHAKGDTIYPGLGAIIAQSLEEQLFRWLRAAELTCDRAALLVAQDPKVFLSSWIHLNDITLDFQL